MDANALSLSNLFFMVMRRAREGSSMASIAIAISGIYAVEMPTPARVVLVVLAAAGFCTPDKGAK